MLGDSESLILGLLVALSEGLPLLDWLEVPVEEVLDDVLEEVLGVSEGL